MISVEPAQLISGQVSKLYITYVNIHNLDSKGLYGPDLRQLVISLLWNVNHTHFAMNLYVMDLFECSLIKS